AYLRERESERGLAPDARLRRTSRSGGSGTLRAGVPAVRGRRLGGARRGARGLEGGDGGRSCRALLGAGGRALDREGAELTTEGVARSVTPATLVSQPVSCAGASRAANGTRSRVLEVAMQERDLSDRAQRHPEKAHRPDTPILRKPRWIRVKAPTGEGYNRTREIMR